MTRRPPGQKLQVRVELEFPCPFCGLKVQIGYAGEDQCGLHLMPPCQEFIDTDLVDLLVIVRTEAQHAAGMNKDAPS